MPSSLVPEFPIVTAEKPRANLSGGEVAAPFRDLANAMEKTGGALTDISEVAGERAGEEAGRKSVRTADDGSLVVDDTRNPFIVGPAAERYARAAKMTQLAQMQPKIETDLLDLRLKHQNDPGGFQAAAKAYADTTLNGDPDKETPGIQDPHLRGAVSDIITTNTQHNLRTSLIEANSNNTAEALQTYQAQIKNLNEQMSSLARQGGTGTPEYLAKAKDRATLWQNLQADPRFKFSKERADLETDEAFSNDKVQEKIGEAQRLFQTKRNAGEAQKYLQDAFWGPGSEKLNLTARQRDRGVAEGLHALANLSAQDREAISENRQAATAYINNLRTEPNSFDEGQHNNMVHQAEAVGDYRSAGDLREAKVFQPLWAELKKMGPDERATALQQMYRGIVPGTAKIDVATATPDRLKSFFAERGPSARTEGMQPEFASRLMTAIQAAEQATGQKTQINSLTRTNEEQQAAYRRYQSGQGGLAAPPGSSRHEIGQAADIQPGKVLDWLHQHADEYGLEFLKGRAFSADPVHIQLTRGAEAMAAGQHIDISADNATARLFQTTVKELRERVGKDADKAAVDIDNVIKEGSGFAPGQLEHFARLATLSGKEDLVDKITPALIARDAQNGLPEGTSPTALHAEIEAAKKAGMPTVARQAADMLDRQFEHDYQQMHENPLTYGGAAGWHGKIGPLDATNPQAFTAEIASREKSIGIDRQKIRDLGPVSAIAPQEGKSLATALTAGDPKAAMQILEGMRVGLSPENWRATMASEPIRNAVTDMARSNDPARMNAGMMTLDKLWTANAPEFDKTYGEHTLTRLLAWKGLQALTPDMMVERLNKADDPYQAKGREEVAKAVDAEFKGTTPADVAYQLGSSWGIPIVSRMANIFTGATPAPPVDAVKAGAMEAEYKETVKALRTYDVAPDTAKRLAVERLKTQWQPTRLLEGSGPTLMKYAPETYYPQVDGSHDWMRRDMEQFVSGVYGSKVASVSLEGASAALPGWTLKGIVSDAQTEQEVQRGQPPSYRIHIIDANGQDQFVRDPKTGQDRIRWNPASAQAEYQGQQKTAFDRRQLETAIFQQNVSNRRLGFNPALGGDLPGQGGMP